MSRFSKKTLRKLNKDELVGIIQEQDVKHERHEEHMEDLVTEVKNLTASFTKLKFYGCLHHFIKNRWRIQFVKYLAN